MEDSFRHKGLRRKLIEELLGKGINNADVLDAINKVPRHAFMDSGFINFAYRDQAFPIGAGQTISQPYTVAFQTQLLEIKKLDKVLEVGTGSGYQCAVLLELGAMVYTIERQRELFMKSQSLLLRLGYKPHFFFGDGYEGIPAYSPFDKILITAAAPEIPPRLLEQLKVGGKLVMPVGDSSVQRMTLVEKLSINGFHYSEHGAFNFVPLLKGKIF
ncbi:MAG: protein-L-isoaspartate(D-aspartate) O-methyltransferase [Bacteroidota bacterium]|nr:protein-L-isoaspartate(D-aspartate) O-methyltransferase [Bacteroidota bacterium]